MSFLRKLLPKSLYPPEHNDEVNRLMDELIRIGKTDDYLSERPGGGFNIQCRHIRTREIGTRLHEIGGLDLMLNANKKVRKQLGANVSEHLHFAWAEIGDWIH